MIVDECSEIEGVSINPVGEIAGVASFSNEAATCVTLPYEQPTTGFTKSVDSYQDLKEYFQRPRLIANGTIPTTRTRMLANNTTRDVIFNTWFPSGFTRLLGAYGVRFNMKFHVTVAASPFQQGILAASFQYGVNTGDAEIYERSTNSAVVTQLPHVILDIAESTMVTLDVPFILPYDFMPLVGNDAGNIGLFSINTILPYRTTTSASPTWKLFVSLHDLELIGSVPQVLTTVIPQTGFVKKAEGYVKTAVKARDAVVKGYSVMTGEAKATGTISKLFSGVSKVASVAGKVPGLGFLGGTTSWAASIAAGTAAAFGYAKPVDENEPSKVWRTDYIADSQIDVPTQSYVVGPFQTNKLAVSSVMGGSDTDELAMEFVLSKYAQIFVGDFSTTDTIGVALYATQICPTNFWFRTNSGRPGGNLPMPTASTLTTNAIATTPLFYFSNFFRNWRGGMKFRFTFSKTKFHAGRVIVGYVPNLIDNNTATVVTNVVNSVEVTGGLPQPFSYSEIFDLRDGSVFEFEVPYVSPLLYSSVLGSTGGLTMTVIDPLIANGEAASSIDYMIEVCAMPDFEFSVSAPPSLVPVNGAAGLAFLQSGMAGVGPSDEMVSEHTIGEKFMSLKQIMMIPSYIGSDVANLSINSTTLVPWFYRPKWPVATPMSSTSAQYFGATRSGNISACYTFVNGSTSWHAYSDVKDRVAISVEQNTSDNNTSFVGFSDPRDKESFQSNTLRVYSTLGVMHFITPFFSKLARLVPSGFNFFLTPRNWAGIGSNVVSTSFQTLNLHNLRVRNTSGATIRLVLGRAAGDDARAACYVGTPPVFIFPSTLANPLDQGTLY